jgi:hypothetical protein
MLRVIIESPLSAVTRAAIEFNKDYARRAMKDSLSRGEAPYASHLLFDQPGILDELSKGDRELGMRAGQAWYVCADKVVVYEDYGVTAGMRAGIDIATKYNIRVEFRRIDDVDND